MSKKEIRRERVPNMKKKPIPGQEHKYARKYLLQQKNIRRAVDNRKPCALSEELLDALASWDISGWVSLDNLFYKMQFVKWPDLSNWNTSNIKSMKNTFAKTNCGDIDLSKWNVENLETTESMFEWCTGNPLLTDWHVSSKLKSTKRMFAHSNFDREIHWPDSSINNATEMFMENRAFDQKLVMGVDKPLYIYMFKGAKNFNQELTGLRGDENAPISTAGMFQEATKFNRVIPFSMGSCKNISYMFFSARSYAQRFPRNSDFSKVTNYEWVFVQSKYHAPLMDIDLWKDKTPKKHELSRLYGHFDFIDSVALYIYEKNHPSLVRNCTTREECWVQYQHNYASKALGSADGVGSEFVTKSDDTDMSPVRVGSNLKHNHMTFADIDGNSVSLNDADGMTRKTKSDDTGVSSIGVGSKITFAELDPILRDGNYVPPSRAASMIKRTPITYEEARTELGKMLTKENKVAGKGYELSDEQLERIELWDTSEWMSLEDMWSETSLVKWPDLSGWNTSKITDMRYAFSNSNCNDDANIKNWDVTHVLDMSSMFTGCTGNPDISNWDPKRVQDISYMFAESTSMNPDLSTWVMEDLNEISGVFNDNHVFNNPIGIWRIKSTEASAVFMDASMFNQSVDGLKFVDGLENAEDMFNGATSFNGDVTGLVKQMSKDSNACRMFYNAEAFEGNGLKHVKFALEEQEDMLTDTKYETEPDGVCEGECESNEVSVDDENTNDLRRDWIVDDADVYDDENGIGKLIPCGHKVLRHGGVVSLERDRC